MKRYVIQWESSKVEPVGDFYELRVTVQGADASRVWADRFNRLAVRAYRNARPHPWGLIVVSGTTILVPDLEPGAEQALIDHLTALVEATDLNGSQRESDERVAAERDPWEWAAEIAERFRSTR